MDLLSQLIIQGGLPFRGALMIRALLLGVDIRAPDFWKLRCGGSFFAVWLLYGAFCGSHI